MLIEEWDYKDLGTIRIVHKMTVLQGLSLYLLFPFSRNRAHIFDVLGVAYLPYPEPNSIYFIL